MAKVTITCAWCGAEHEMELGEYNYWMRRGRDYFFCSRSCTSKYRNADKVKFRENRTQICEYCHKEFVTSSKYAVRFCSRSCASAGSMSAERRARQVSGGHRSQELHPASPASMQRLLKLREAHKYTKLDELLNSLSIDHEFEFLLDAYIYDLALISRKLLFEFDGSYHDNANQKAMDDEKDRVASSYGWSVIRLPENGSSVIDPNLILPYLVNNTTN